MDATTELAPARLEPSVELYSEASRQYNLAAGRSHFLAYRKLMNPRFVLGWFVISLAWRLQEFYADFVAGKRPIMLLCTPPQHGKSLAILDFIAWLVGLLPNTKVIYSSFSDRLGIRANLRMQRALDDPKYHAMFGKLLDDRGGVTAQRNYNILEMMGHEGYFRNTTVMGSRND